MFIKIDIQISIFNPHLLSDAHLRCCLDLQTTTPHTADTVLTRAVAVTTPTSTAHSEAAPP